MNGKQLKNSILQWAIQGKLVPQDPNDEPASVLLERIREEKARLVKEKKIKKDKNESIIFRGDDNSHYEKFADGTVKCIDDEIPFEIPQSWCWVRLAQVLTVKGGKRIPLGDSFAPGHTSHIYIRVTEMKNHTLVTNNLKYISDSVYEKIKNYTIGKDDLYLTIAGTIGSVGIVPEMFDGMNLTENAVKLTNILIDKMFLVYGISSQFVQSQFSEKTKQMAQPKLAIERILTTLIPLPPINEQISIVSRIEEIMPIADKYEKSQEALDKLNADIFDKLKKSVLQEAIQGKLVPQNPNDEPASVLLERIKAEKKKLFREDKLKKKDLVDSVIFKGEDNKYYETIDGVTECIDEEIPYDLPSNWAWTRLGNIAKMTIGKTPARGDQRFWSNGEYSWVSISDMKDLGVISATKERISAIAVKELMGNISPKGSLLMSFKLTVGRTSLLDMDAYHNEAIVTVLPLIDECNTFRNYLFRTLPLLSVAGDSKDAIKGKTLNSQSLSRLLIPLPPMSEQERIVQELQRVTSLMN